MFLSLGDELFLVSKVLNQFFEGRNCFVLFLLLQKTLAQSKLGLGRDDTVRVGIGHDLLINVLCRVEISYGVFRVDPFSSRFASESAIAKPPLKSITVTILSTNVFKVTSHLLSDFRVTVRAVIH